MMVLTWVLVLPQLQCVMHLEDRLQELYFKSKMLSEYLRGQMRVHVKELGVVLGFVHGFFSGFALSIALSWVKKYSSKLSFFPFKYLFLLEARRFHQLGCPIPYKSWSLLSTNLKGIVPCVITVSWECSQGKMNWNLNFCLRISKYSFLSIKYAVCLSFPASSLPSRWSDWNNSTLWVVVPCLHSTTLSPFSVYYVCLLHTYSQEEDSYLKC